MDSVFSVGLDGDCPFVCLSVVACAIGSSFGSKFIHTFSLNFVVFRR